MAAPARRLDSQLALHEDFDRRVGARSSAPVTPVRKRGKQTKAAGALLGAPTSRPILLPDPPPVEPGERDDLKRLRASLESRIAAKVMNATELIRAVANRSRDELLPTTLAPLDALLGGGLPRGKAVEIAGRRSAGRFSIVLSALAAATSSGEAAALIDLGDNFDPQIGAANGIELERLLWIRPRTLKQAVMAAEMIAATGFQLVIIDAGSHPIRGRRVPDAAWVRLARTAEANGTAMLISTPYPLTGTATEAVVSAHTARARWIGRGKSPRILAGTTVAITLEKHRHVKPGRSETLVFRTDDAVLVEQTAGVIPSRRNPEGVERGEEPPAVEREANQRGGSFAALRRSAHTPSPAAPPAQDDTAATPIRNSQSAIRNASSDCRLPSAV